MRSAADHDDDHGNAVCGRLGHEGQLLGREPEIGRVTEFAGGVRPPEAAPAADEDNGHVGLLDPVYDLEPLTQRLQRRRRGVLRWELCQLAADW